MIDKSFSSVFGLNTSLMVKTIEKYVRDRWFQVCLSMAIANLNPSWKVKKVIEMIAMLSDGGTGTSLDVAISIVEDLPNDSLKSDMRCAIGPLIHNHTTIKRVCDGIVHSSLTINDIVMRSAELKYILSNLNSKNTLVQFMKQYLKSNSVDVVTAGLLFANFTESLSIDSVNIQNLMISKYQDTDSLSTLSLLTEQMIVNKLMIPWLVVGCDDLCINPSEFYGLIGSLKYLSRGEWKINIHDFALTYDQFIRSIPTKIEWFSEEKIRSGVRLLSRIMDRSELTECCKQATLINQINIERFFQLVELLELDINTCLRIFHPFITSDCVRETIVCKQLVKVVQKLSIDRTNICFMEWLKNWLESSSVECKEFACEMIVFHQIKSEKLFKILERNCVSIGYF